MKVDSTVAAITPTAKPNESRMAQQNRRQARSMGPAEAHQDATL